MGLLDVDPVDFGILYLLQQNARDATTKEMAERVGVAPSTVATRIRNLEDAGVIDGYQPTIDYGKAGFDHTHVVIGTGPHTYDTHGDFLEKLSNVDGVVNVRKFAGGEDNFSVELVGKTRQQVFERLGELNDRGLTISRIEMVMQERTQPFNHFGEHLVDNS